MKKINKNWIFAGTGFFLTFFSIYFFGYDFVFAEVHLSEYVPLVNLPGMGSGPSSIPDFINTVYKVTLGLGALLGVIKIAFAGVKYSMSDVITDKNVAKKDILGVLLGLAILLMPYIVLNTIYPGFLELDFIESIEEQNLKLDTPTRVDNTKRDKVACNKSPGARWDPVCNRCIPIRNTDGSICEQIKKPPEEVRVEIGCDKADVVACVKWCEGFNKSLYNPTTKICSYIPKT